MPRSGNVEVHDLIPMSVSLAHGSVGSALAHRMLIERDKLKPVGPSGNYRYAEFDWEKGREVGG